MKTLILIRHAKSSWADPGQNDFDRPLNERGRKDAPEMAARLYKRTPHIDLFLSSTAKRARKTAAFFAEAYGKTVEDIQLVPSLYMAGIPEFLEQVKALPDTVQTVALFSHNYGITAFANTLSSVRVDNMPTCSFYAVELECSHWKDIETATTKFLFFDYPKAVQP